MTHWSQRYVGLPFADRGRDQAGVDCYGLVRLVLAEVHGIALPSYAETYACVAERAEIAAALSGAAGRGPWQAVAPGGERPFDVAMFSVFGAPLHVGLVVRRGLMLHVSAGIESRIEDYAGGAWAPRLLAFYRHEALCPSP